MKMVTANINVLFIPYLLFVMGFIEKIRPPQLEHFKLLEKVPNERGIKFNAGSDK
jgi:hypothetical protein